MTDWHEQLTAEHRETERLLACLQTQLEASCWQEAEVLYAQLSRDLLRHYALEEQALFPVLSQYRSMMLMELEHDELLRLQQAFADALESSIRHQTADPELFQRLAAFRQQLGGHILQEDSRIFPMAEEILESEEQLKVNRLFQELNQSASEPVLVRPTPGFVIAQTGHFPMDSQKPKQSDELLKPVCYQTLYEREHASIQHIGLQAGQALARHWAGQHQYLLVLSGLVEFRTDEQMTQLTSGMSASLDSRLAFSLIALSETHLLVFKVWPHPHYTKA